MAVHSILLSRCPGFRTTHIDQARRHIARFFRVHASDTGPGVTRIDFRHHHAALADITVNEVRYGAEIAIQSRPLRDFYLVQWTLEGSCRYERPEEIDEAGPGTVYVVNPFEPHRKIWGKDCTQVILRVDRDLVDRRTGMAGPVRFDPGPHPRTTRTAILFDMLRLVVDGLGAESPQLAMPRVSHSLQDALLDMLLATIPNDHSAPGATAAQAPPPHLRDALDFIKVHAREPIRPADIARAAGVRPRTLQKVFLRHTGMSPGTFLKTTRLDLARRDLEDAGPGGASVTRIAMDCGFQHMGRFAGDFRRRFGLSPSEARARR